MSIENQQQPRALNDNAGNDALKVYENTAVVKVAKQELSNLLAKSLDDANFLKQAKKIIYKLLTRREIFTASTDGKGKTAEEVLKPLEIQKNWYRSVREKLEEYFQSTDGFKWESNPGWFGVNTRPEVPKRSGINYKAYTTISPTEYTFIKDLPSIAGKLRELALKSDDIIQVKIPESFSGFISQNDSIVVHFKKQENKEKIFKILDAWMSESNIHQLPRELGRTRFAADSLDASFSDLVANNIANYLKTNKDKYDSSVLANEAIRHAILQSQKEPTVI